MAQWLRPNCGLSEIETIALFAGSDMGRTDPKRSAPTSVHNAFLGAAVTPTQRYAPEQCFVGGTVPPAAHRRRPTDESRMHDHCASKSVAGNLDSCQVTPATASTTSHLNSDLLLGQVDRTVLTI
jgi:hypothetical protein